MFLTVAFRKPECEPIATPMMAEAATWAATWVVDTGAAPGRRRLDPSPPPTTLTEDNVHFLAERRHLVIMPLEGRPPDRHRKV